MDDMFEINDPSIVNNNAFDIMDLINKIKSKEKIDFENLTDDIVMFKDQNGKTVLEYLIENDYLNKNEILFFGSIYEIKNIEKALIYYKYGFNNVLNNGLKDEKIFMTKLSNGKTLFDLLLESNRVENNMMFVLEDNLDALKSVVEHDKWDLVNYFNADLLNGNRINGKTYLEILFEKGLVNSKAIKQFYQSEEEFVHCMDLCIQYDKKELIKEVNASCFDNILRNGVSVIEYLFQQNLVDDNIIRRYRNTKDLVELCVKYNKIELLSNANDKTLMYKIDGTKTVLEYLIEHNCNIDNIINTVNYCDYQSDLISILLKYERFDILIDLNNKTIFEMIDLNRTLFDAILDYYDKNNDFDLDSIISQIYDKNYRTKIYIGFAKHGIVEMLPTLNKKALLSTYKNDTFLEELLKIDPQLTYDILPEKEQKDLEIAIILKKYGIDQEAINIPLDKDNYSKEYLTDFQKIDYDTKLTQEEKEIVDEFRTIMSDGKSSQSLIDTISNAYIKLISTNNIYALRDLSYLIQMKKDNPEFSLLECEDGCYYRPSNKTVNMEGFSESTFHHELGHAMNHLIANNYIPDGYEELITRLANNPNVLARTAMFSKKYSEVYERNKEQAISVYAKKYETMFTEEKKQEIEEKLLKDKQEKYKEFEQKGYPKEIIEYLLEKEFSIEEFRTHYIRINAEELFENMFESVFADEGCISDILDAIYEGKLRSHKITEYGLDEIRMAGHGINYYRKKTDKRFDEMIANYAALLKSPRSKESLDILAKIVGPELVYMLQNYYDNVLSMENKVDITR